jgi:uncharacterized membrane protein
MKKGRLEAFSDGVFAIIITIMVLEIKVPHGNTLEALFPLLPIFLSYILSFIYLGIYWNNHHHLLQTVKEVSGDILWANLHLLFWLSLVPFVTGWMGENSFENIPVALYGVILILCAISYTILQGRILKSLGPESNLAKTLGKDWKGKGSILLYLIGIFSVNIDAKISLLLYLLVAIIWLVPDKRIEKSLKIEQPEK